MHGVIGSIGLIILAAGIAAGGVSLVTSYWQERGEEHRGFWMTCLWRVQKMECISNIEGDADKSRYSNNDWYKAVVCCHAFGVVSGFLAALHTLWTICSSNEKSSKTFFAVTLAIISSILYMCSVAMWKTQVVEDGEGFKDAWSFFLGISAAAVTGIAAGIITVAVFVK